MIKWQHRQNKMCSRGMRIDNYLNKVFIVRHYLCKEEGRSLEAGSLSSWYGCLLFTFAGRGFELCCTA